MADGYSIIVGLIEKGGPLGIAGIFAWLWWNEYKERKECQKAFSALQDARLVDAKTSSSEVTAALVKNTSVTEAQTALIKTITQRTPQ
jgi:predicted negative regulator of RcsB-dependent stress response